MAKTEVGFSHFEGRNYVAQMRHLILCLIVLGFASERSDRLRGEKSGGDTGTGLPGIEPEMRSLAGTATGDIGVGAYLRSH